jgi:HK97 family phage prohead protease
MTQSEFQARWQHRREIERRLDEAEQRTSESKLFTSRVDMVIARLGVSVLTKDISVPATGARPIQIKRLDVDRGTFDAYCSTWQIDRQGDQIQRGAFAKSIRERPQVPMLWSHATTEVIGKCSDFTEDSYGLKFRGEVCRGVRRAEEALLLLRADCIDSFSIGYAVTDYSPLQNGDRLLTKVELLEISIVPVAANPGARLAN